MFQIKVFTDSGLKNLEDKANKFLASQDESFELEQVNFSQTNANHAVCIVFSVDKKEEQEEQTEEKQEEENNDANNGEG